MAGSQRPRLVRPLCLLLSVVAALALTSCASPEAADAPAPAGLSIQTHELQLSDVDTVRVATVAPDGTAGRPLLVFLHGKGGDVETYARRIADALGDASADTPVLVLPDGRGSYFHDRATGNWGAMLTDLETWARDEFDLDDRTAVGGISMGGYGALLRGLRNGPYCAVGAHSPALWESAGLTAPGAFDNAEDFAAHDVLAELGAWDPKVPLYVDIGTADPFEPAAVNHRSVIESIPSAEFHERPGRHDWDYWGEHLPEYLNWYEAHLANC